MLWDPPAGNDSFYSKPSAKREYHQIQKRVYKIIEKSFLREQI